MNEQPLINPLSSQSIDVLLSMQILRDEDWRVRGLQQSPAEERSTKLRMFLDSASPKELLKWARLGLFFGVCWGPGKQWLRPEQVRRDNQQYGERRLQSVLIFVLQQ